MKKIVSSLLVLLVLFGVSVNSFAMEGLVNSVKVNEYDIYKELVSKTDKELVSQGLSKDEITELRNIDLVKLLSERAELDVETLKAMGYTDVQIENLKKVYLDTQINPSSADLDLITPSGIFADLTLDTWIVNHSGSEIIVGFEWEWSNLPLVYGLRDVVGFAWEGTNSNGQPINVSLNKNKSHHTSYETNNYINVPPSTLSLTTVRSYGAAKSEFTLGYRIEDMIGWIQSGDGQIAVQKVGTDNIHEISLNISYGHTIITGSPSISFPTGYTINFGLRTEEMNSVIARYTAAGRKIIL